MAWLLRDGEVLASAEVAADRRARRQGLLGRDRVDGAAFARAIARSTSPAVAVPVARMQPFWAPFSRKSLVNLRVSMSAIATMLVATR